MWKWEYNIFNCRLTTKLMIMGKSGWEQSLVVVGVVKKEILRF